MQKIAIYNEKYVVLVYLSQVSQPAKQRLCC